MQTPKLQKCEPNVSCKSWCWPLVHWLCSWTQDVCLHITQPRIWVKTIKCLVTLEFAPAPQRSSLWFKCAPGYLFLHFNVVKHNFCNNGLHVIFDPLFEYYFKFYTNTNIQNSPIGLWTTVLKNGLWYLHLVIYFVLFYVIIFLDLPYLIGKKRVEMRRICVVIMIVRYLGNG